MNIHFAVGVLRLFFLRGNQLLHLVCNFRSINWRSVGNSRIIRVKEDIPAEATASSSFGFDKLAIQFFTVTISLSVKTRNIGPEENKY